MTPVRKLSTEKLRLVVEEDGQLIFRTLEGALLNGISCHGLKTGSGPKAELAKVSVIW